MSLREKIYLSLAVNTLVALIIAFSMQSHLMYLAAVEVCMNNEYPDQPWLFSKEVWCKDEISKGRIFK